MKRAMQRPFFPLAVAMTVSLIACGRVPGQALRDEQARSRKYRDAYETSLQENEALKKRMAEAEQRAAGCPAAQQPPPLRELPAPSPGQIVTKPHAGEGDADLGDGEQPSRIR